MLKLVKTDWLFFLLLTGTAVAHVAIGWLSDTQRKVTLGSVQQGESSIAVQLLATRGAPERDLKERVFAEDEISYERSQPQDLKHLEEDQVYEIEVETIRQESESDQDSFDEIFNQRGLDFTEFTVDEISVELIDLPANPGNISDRKTLALKSNAAPLKPVHGKTIQSQGTIAERQLTKRLPQKAESVVVVETEKLSTVPLKRTPSVVELDLEVIVSDTAPQNGNAEVEAFVEPMNGANTAPSLVSKNALNRPPAFPQELISQGVSGTVKLEVTVLPDGKVKSTRVVLSTGFEKLDQLAQQAVAHWQFNPGLTNGQAITKRVIVPITFKIEKRRAGVLKRQ